MLPSLSLRRRRPRPEGGRPREVVVLSGGGSLGAAQVGALRALFEAGIVPDLLVGCSVGALNAAFLAIDPTAARVEQLAEVWGRLERQPRLRRPAAQVAAHLVRRDDHLYEPDALRDLVRRWVPLRDLAETAVPCHVVTTDLLDGAPCWWSAGDPVPVLTAQRLPAGDLPARGAGRQPARRRRRHGARARSTGRSTLGAVRTWVLDVSGGTIGRRDARMTALDVLLLSFAISRSQLDRAPAPGRRRTRRWCACPGSCRGRFEMRDFSQTERLMDAGYAVARPVVEAALGAVPRASAPAEPTGSRASRQQLLDAA